MPCLFSSWERTTSASSAARCPSSHTGQSTSTLTGVSPWAGAAHVQVAPARVRAPFKAPPPDPRPGPGHILCPSVPAKLNGYRGLRKSFGLTTRRYRLQGPTRLVEEPVVDNPEPVAGGAAEESLPRSGNSSFRRPPTNPSTSTSTKCASLLLRTQPHHPTGRIATCTS